MAVTALAGVTFMLTNEADADVKSCGPDLPVLRSNLRSDELAGDGGKKAGPRGDHV